MFRLFLVIWIILFTLISSNLQSQPYTQPRYLYYTLTSKHFQIHFPEPFLEIAKYILQMAEKIHNQLEPRYRSGANQTHLVLVFNHDVSNAFTTVHGLDTIILYLTQPEIGEFANYKDWFYQLILHEYTHILTLRQYQGWKNNLFRLFFGVPPNLSLPDGIIEGIAVREESYEDFDYHSQPIPIGRLYDTNTNAIIRQQILYSTFPSLEETLGGSYYWPLGKIPYLYGGRYTDTIIQTSGERSFIHIFHSKSLPIALEIRFSDSHLFSLDFYYKQWILKEHKRVKHWLQKKFLQPITIYEQLTFTGGFKKYLKQYEDQIFYFEQSSFRSPGIYQLSIDKKQTKLQYRAKSIKDFFINKLNQIFTSEPKYFLGGNIIQNTIYFNGKEIIFQEKKDTRKWFPVQYKNFLIYIEQYDPYIQIVKVPFQIENHHVKIQTQKKQILIKTNFFYNINFPILVDHWLFSIIKFQKSLQTGILQCNLKTNQCKIILSANFTITTLNYQKDQKQLLFSANINDNYEIYHFDIDNQKVYQLTNSILSFQYPVFYKNSLYVIGETFKGFDIFRIPQDSLFQKDVSNEFNFNPIRISDIELKNKKQEIEEKSKINTNQIQEYSFYTFRFYLDGILTNQNTDLAFQISGYDPIRRHNINMGAGTLENYTLYFFEYLYNRFLPNLLITYTKTNPFDSDRNCPFSIENIIRYYLCNNLYGFESYSLAFQFPHWFRLIQTNIQIGFRHQKNKNTFFDGSRIYWYNDFNQNSIFFQYEIQYLENYYESISPENGFRFQLRTEYFPELWNYAWVKQNKERFDYTNISFRFEFFLPWWLHNHVPYWSLFATWNQGIHSSIIQSRLGIYQKGIELKTSSYGKGNFVSTFEYRFPLLYSSKRIFSSLPELGIHWIALAPFYEIGKSFNYNLYDSTQLFHSRGIRVDIKMYIFFLPFILNLIYANGTEEQFSFGISLNTNFHTQFLQKKLHTEYLLPTWHYK